MGVIDLVLNNKKNKGFTLVELIVAVAVLALLITAVVTMMGHESVILKKHEADISVQTSAQETYNDIADIIMQAKKIRIVGYSMEDGSEIEFSKKIVGDTYKGTSDPEILAFSKKSEVSGDDKNFEDSIDLLKDPTTSEYKKFYLYRIYVDYSVPYDPAFRGSVDEDGEEEVEVPAGTDKDTCSAVIIFDANRIYITKEYKYMTRLNSTFGIGSSDAERDACLYTSKLNYVKNGAATYSAAIATIDPENQSISLELRFLDNKMTYNVSGMINVKNSYVFIDAK